MRTSYFQGIAVMPTIGILAYGSLIEDPGPEIEAARLRTEHNVKNSL